MASERDHVRLANRNHEALELLRADGKHAEWITTIAFYKAVHVVEAVLASHFGWHSSSHDDRLKSLKAQSAFQPVFKPFRTLYALSRTARYLEGGTFADVVPGNDVEQKVLKKLLLPIEDNCLQFLSDDARGMLLRIQV